MKFQVDVEKATPVCSADCPNLEIDIVELHYPVDRVEDLHKLRKFRCVNDECCRRVYAAFNEERSGKE